MPFHVPDNLDDFSVPGLQDLRKQAENEYKTLVASVAPETVTTDDLDRLEELQQFYRVEVPNVISGRKDRSDRLGALTAAANEPEPVVEPTPEPTPPPPSSALRRG